MPTDLFKVDANYYDTSTQTIVTATWTDLGSGMPGDASQYVGDGESPDNHYDTPTSGGGNTNPGAPGPGGTIGDGGYKIYPPGTDPNDTTVVFDPAPDAILVSPLDVVIREGFYIASGDSLTDTATPTTIEQTGAGTAWENVQQIVVPVEGGEDTFVSLGNDASSQILKFSGFKIDVPLSYELTGMTVTINREVISGSLASETGNLYRCVPVQESTYFHQGRNDEFNDYESIAAADYSGGTYEITSSPKNSQTRWGLFSYDDEYLATAGTSTGDFNIYETTTWTHDYDPANSVVNCYSNQSWEKKFAWSRDNAYIAMLHYDNFTFTNDAIQIRNVGTWSTATTVSLEAGITTSIIAVDWTNNHLVFFDSVETNHLSLGAAYIHVVNKGTWTAEASISLSIDTPYDIAVSPDGSVLYVACTRNNGGGVEGTVIEVDTSTWTETTYHASASIPEIINVAFGTGTVAIGYSGNTVKTHDPSDWTETGSWSVTATNSGVSISNAGGYIVVSHYSNWNHINTATDVVSTHASFWPVSGGFNFGTKALP